MRALVPPVVLILAWLGSLTVVDSGSTTAASLALVPYVASLLLGAAAVYPAMRRRGAGIAVAAVGGFVVPILWIAKECWAMARLYTPGEAAYYALNPVALGLVTAAAVQMAAAELVVRRVRTGRWSFRNGAGLVLATIAVAAGVVAGAIRHTGPTAVFWAYVQGHRRLFDQITRCTPAP
jgi:hypothetical protein